MRDEARGFWLCGTCGRSLEWPKPVKAGANRRPARGQVDDPYGHAASCAQSGQPPAPHAITSKAGATTYRIHVVLPPGMREDAYQSWGNSLGYALRTGMRLLFMLDGTEIEFELEAMYRQRDHGVDVNVGTLCFIDAAVGGSGFLDRAANELHLVAKSAQDHLDHPHCESACYRCLKSYQNQRVHTLLSWPQIIPDLEQLATSAPMPCPAERGDLDDPGPWLEAFDAGVGSPLELKFLRVFEAAGINLIKQKEVTADPGGPNVSIADFVVADTKVAIYIDGAAFHHGQRLRRDRQIRARLRDGGNAWTVLEFGARDLGRQANLLELVREAMEMASVAA